MKPRGTDMTISASVTFRNTDPKLPSNTDPSIGSASAISTASKEGNKISNLQMKCLWQEIMF
jgi:hypothetical protein